MNKILIHRKSDFEDAKLSQQPNSPKKGLIYRQISDNPMKSSWFGLIQAGSKLA